MTSCNVDVLDPESVRWQLGFRVNPVFERLESEAIDLHVSSTTGWARDRIMIGHNRILVVLERRVWVLLVHDTLTRELLVVVGDLDR